MSDREVKVDNGWVDSHSVANQRLLKKGYAVGGYTDKGVAKYVLYRMNGKFERVHEFDTSEELNNMLKLLLDEGD